MTKRNPLLLSAAVLAMALSLTACGRGGGQDEGNLANLDNQLVGNDVDPALTSAINDQIMVDPTLTNQSNRNAVRPPETPTQAQYPAEGGPGAPAGGKSGGGDIAATAAQGGAPCAGGQFDTNIRWASRLSPAFPLYPGARVTEAAGNEKAGCHARVVSFTTPESWQRVVEYYATRARAAGYDAEQQTREGDHVLGGTNDGDGGAYYLIVTPQPNGGSDVSLITNNGR